MKLQRIVVVVVVVFFALSVKSYSSAAPANSAAAFLGRWDLTLKSADHEYPSWLELSEENGQLKAQMVGRWGNARPLPKAELINGHLTFVSPKEEEDLPQDMVFEGTCRGRLCRELSAGRKTATGSGPASEHRL
jgi:hypothetical protein